MFKWILGIFLVLVIGGAAIAYFSDDDGKVVAEIACEDLVKDQLKAPSTADFDHSTRTQDGDTWTIKGSVESDNALGNPVASDYSCVVTVDGDKWKGRAQVRDR